MERALTVSDIQIRISVDKKEKEEEAVI